MGAEPSQLLTLAEAVADGRPVDWDQAESGRAADDVQLVRQLRLLAEVATVSWSGAPAPAPATPLQPGTRWGTLEVREPIGAGTFGIVYRAWDSRLDREVALKLLNRSDTSLESADAMVAEGRRLAKVRHPHVVVVHGADCVDGRVGIWMDFIRGRTLENVLQEQGPLGAREAAIIGVDLCGALAAVHKAGLVHRDVKSQNVMREEGGRIVLMDFGAGEERGGDEFRRAAGTPLYMAPELLAGKDASAQTDIYSLGVLLYRLVTGSYPLDAPTSGDLMEKHREGARKHLRDERPDLPPAFVAIVERALAPAPEHRFLSAGDMEHALEHVLSATTPRTAGTRARLSQPRMVGLVALAVVAIGMLAFPALRSALKRWRAPAPVRFAVLPFSNPTGASAQEHVVVGMREVLVNRLATLQGLVVISPVNGDRPNDLDVGFLVDGSAHREGDRLRAAVRVTRAGTGVVIWSEAFDRPLGDLFALQNDIATTVARVAGVRVSEAERQRLSSRYSTSAEAQDAYLQGRHHLYRFNRQAAAMAREHLERAVAIDPSYALAHASLARVYLLLQEYRDLLPQDAQPLALTHARRAAELGRDLPEARVALAEVLFKVERDVAGAEREYRAGLDLSPGSSLVRSPYARFLSAADRPNEALEHALEGARRDPLSPEMMASVGITYVYLRDFDNARQWYERSIALKQDYAPGYFGRGRARSFLGHHEDAVADLTRAVALSGSDPSYRAELARISAVGGWRNSAEEILGALLEEVRLRPGAVAPQDLAYVYLALGDRDRAVALLRQALDEKDTRLLFLNVDPRVDSLRGDPRLDEIIRALGL